MAENRKVPRHLIDPATLGQPRPGRNLAEEKRKLERVQRWVMSVLVVTTVFHLSVGLVIAAALMGEDRGASRYGLVVIAGVLLMGAVGVARAVHRRSPVSPWLLVGLLPTLVGVILLVRG